MPESLHVQFGEFEFDARDPDRPKLLCDGSLVTAKPQALKFLLLLLSKANVVVTRDEVALALWNDVSRLGLDDGINRVAGEVRKALRDDATDPRWLATISGSGYKFVGRVAVVNELDSNKRVQICSREAETNGPTTVSRVRSRSRLAAIAIILVIVSVAYWFVARPSTAFLTGQKIATVDIREVRSRKQPVDLAVRDDSMMAQSIGGPNNDRRFSQEYNAGRAAMKLKKYESAVVAFTRALETKPEDIESVYNRGSSLMSLEDHEEAAKDFTRVIGADGRPTAYYNRGVCFMHLERLDEAEQDFSHVIAQPALEPAGLSLLQRALRNRAKVRTRLNNPVGAAADEKQADAL